MSVSSPRSRRGSSIWTSEAAVQFGNDGPNGIDNMTDEMKKMELDWINAEGMELQ